MALDIPIGYEFEPTKQELVGHYLRIKLNGQPLPTNCPQFLDYNIYKDHPFNILSSTEQLRRVHGADNRVLEEGYFFTQHKETNGKIKSRVIENHGTWVEKSGTNKNVYDKAGKAIGMYKYYKFNPVNEAKESHLNKDEWGMYEYSLIGAKQDMVLCHIIKEKEVSNEDDEVYNDMI